MIWFIISVTDASPRNPRCKRGQVKGWFLETLCLWSGEGFSISGIARGYKIMPRRLIFVRPDIILLRLRSKKLAHRRNFLKPSMLFSSTGNKKDSNSQQKDPTSKLFASTLKKNQWHVSENSSGTEAKSIGIRAKRMEGYKKECPGGYKDSPGHIKSYRFDIKEQASDLLRRLGDFLPPTVEPLTQVFVYHLGIRDVHFGSLLHGLIIS